MVARKVLDGLRKGKKDVYALNVQYVKRYIFLHTLLTFTDHYALLPAADHMPMSTPPGHS